MEEEQEKYITATQAIRMLGWTRKYFYRVIQELQDREPDLELNKSHGFPPQRLIPVSLVTTLKTNWKKQKWGGLRKVKKPGFLEDDDG